MNKTIANLIQIAYDIMKNEPNFTEIDKKLKKKKKELTKNQTISSNCSIIIIETKKKQT